MKNRVFLPVAFACVLGLGGLGLVGARGYAQGAPTPDTFVAAPGIGQVDAEDQHGAALPDTDNIQEQSGDQVGPDTGDQADLD